MILPSLAREVAAELFQLWGLTELGWVFYLKDSKRTLGLCDYQRKRIVVSLDVLRSGIMEQLLETIKHEIAHVLVGPGNRHNHIWRAKAIEVGCQPVACAEIGAVPESGIGAKYVAECPCGSPHYLYRRVKRLDTRYCVKAGVKAGFLMYKPVKVD